MIRESLAVLAVCVSIGIVRGEDAIATAVEDAIRDGQVPGAVVLVIRDGEVTYREAFGDAAVRPSRRPMSVDGVFDMASLTEPVATAASIWKLIEAGKLDVTDPVAKHWPEFAANGKDKITIANLLLHTGGLIADNSIRDYEDGREKALERIAALKPVAEPGTKFIYSDVGFITLGEVVHRVSGQPLHEFAKTNLFDPLGMGDTTFRPGDRLRDRIVPTSKVGVVHDPRADAMGGIAGHAGLFSTADDLAKFCRMLLDGGELDGVRIFKPETVTEFLAPREVPGGWRSYGWDVDTGFTSQAGEKFTRRDGFGHTGFTGTSIWVDRPSETIVILLTSRLHPDEKGNVVPLRKRVGTIVTGR